MIIDWARYNNRQSLMPHLIKEATEQYGSVEAWQEAGRPRLGESFWSRIDPWEQLKSAGRSIDEEVFQPVFDDIDDAYKEHLRPWMGEIGTAVGTYFGFPQLGAAIGGALEGGTGSGGYGGGGFGGGGGSPLAEQLRGFDEARDFALENQAFARDAFSPYMSAGSQVMNPILAELGIGGTPYEDPMLDEVINQQLRDVQQSRKASGMWGAGSTPGALADATLRTRLAMRDQRMNDLMGVAGLGAQSTGSLIGNEALMTDSLMQNALGRAAALSDAAWLDQQNRNAALQQAGQVGGGLLSGAFDWIGDLFGFGGTDAVDVDTGGGYGGLFDIGDMGYDLGVA